MPKLAKFDDYKAPWELDADGKAVAEEDQEVDKARLKKYIHNLLSDKEKLQESVTTITGERDELQKKADEEARKGETETERLKRENEELKNRKPEVDPVEKLKFEVALDKKLTAKQMSRLVGSTKEELEADADELIESFGGRGGNEEGEEETPPRRHPQRHSNPGDPAPGDVDVDVDKALADIPRIN